MTSALSALLFAAGARADVEAELRAELVGRFALTKSPLLSECTERYSNVEVVGGRVSGGRGERFAEGELARIDNVKAGSFSGLDLYLSFGVPYLLSFQDGPFTLYEERHCRVQLELQVEREVRRDRGKALAAIGEIVELFDDEPSARAAGWNRRERASFPEDWEETRQAHAIWKVDDQNRRVGARIAELLETADQTFDRMSGEERYLASFAAGARARSDSWSECESMLSAGFYVSGSPSPGGDKEGWEDGQRVAWATSLARALQGCILPPPPTE